MDQAIASSGPNDGAARRRCRACRVAAECFVHCPDVPPAISAAARAAVPPHPGPRGQHRVAIQGDALSCERWTISRARSRRSPGSGRGAGSAARARSRGNAEDGGGPGSRPRKRSDPRTTSSFVPPRTRPRKPLDRVVVGHRDRGQLAPIGAARSDLGDSRPSLKKVGMQVDAAAARR